MDLAQILGRNAHDLALLLGNGIHLYGGKGDSWKALLLKLAHETVLDFADLPIGASTTEFFDVLELRARSRSGDMARAFCAGMKNWAVESHHRRVMGWAIRHDVPVLTTNFDEVLSNAADAQLMRPGIRGFTDWYPWDSRFAHALHDDPCDGFGVWHVNGMARYKRSVRLGLTHYVGSADRAREWLHRGGSRLFEAKDPRAWLGRRTWLHLVFNKPLLIIGLGLHENEVFLRWLLIERRRYFAKFPDREQPAWYVFVPDPKDRTAAGRHFFLENIGITCVAAADYAAIYDLDAWDI